MSKAETLYDHGPPINQFALPSSQNPERITLYSPTFDIEQAAWSASFLELHGAQFEQYSIEPLTESTTDLVWKLAGPTKTKQDSRLREERQTNALKALSSICGLPDQEYHAWESEQPETIRRIATFGKRLQEKTISKSGEDTNLLDQMVKLAEARLESAREKVRTRR